MNFEIPLQLSIEIAILVAVGIGIWRIGRWMLKVEMRMDNHEETCNQRHADIDAKFKKIDSHLATIYEGQTEIKQDIAYLKAREEERQ